MILKDLDLVCFSHLRWNFVFQRPQHLMTRFASETRVFFVEDPEFTDQPSSLQVNEVKPNIFVVVPHLQHGSDQDAAKKGLLIEMFAEHSIDKYLFWYYTPMSLSFTNSFTPSLVIYDCMDELSAFKFAPVELKENEQRLFQKSDLVFTGGQSLYEAKKDKHESIYPFPSSIDKSHFEAARSIKNDPPDQDSIGHPRLGFYGVIDERLDIELLGEVAAKRPEWQLVILGPVVKIDPATLPRPANIHYLGGKSYQELPAYISGWDIALIPFALNESTKFISPTKTPEYLSAGKPVISSSIKDVVEPYGANELVHIADSAEDFIRAAETELSTTDRSEWLARVDKFLENISWDKTWAQMVQLINNKLASKAVGSTLSNLNSKENIYV
jgi:UDP-galactopyranose mutase